MAVVHAPGVKFFSTTAGTDDFGIGVAVGSFRLPSDVPLADGDEVDYIAFTASERAVGRGTYVESGGLLTRDTEIVIAGTPGGSPEKVDFQSNPVVALGPLPSSLLVASENLLDVDNAATAFGNIKQAADETNSGVLDKATDAEIFAATAGAHAICAEDLASAAAEVTITDGGSPSFDWAAGVNFVWTMAANRQLPNPSNPIVGTYRTIRFLGNSTTDRTLTFDTQYVGDLPTMTDIDSAQQYLLTIRCISSTSFIVSAQKATTF